MRAVLLEGAAHRRTIEVDDVVYVVRLALPQQQKGVQQPQHLAVPSVSQPMPREVEGGAKGLSQ